MLAGLTAVALLIDPASSGSADALERLAVGFTVRCGLVWDAAGLGRLAALSRAVPCLEKLSLRKSRGGGPGLPATLADFTLVRKERDVSSVCSPRTDRGL